MRGLSKNGGRERRSKVTKEETRAVKEEASGIKDFLKPLTLLIGRNKLAQQILTHEKPATAGRTESMSVKTSELIEQYRDTTALAIAKVKVEHAEEVITGTPTGKRNKRRAGR